jgi:hypothetical protein
MSMTLAKEKFMFFIIIAIILCQGGAGSMR